ncbi:MAG: hypothetical protein Q9222_004484 [Ikaeria aurantiellina]
MTDPNRLDQITYEASAATWPFTALATCLFGIRVFSRAKLLRDALDWDDLVVTVSWVLAIVRAACFQTALNSARGLDLANLPGKVPTAAFWVIFTDAWSFFSIALPKLGIGMLIIRVFRPRRWLKRTILIFCVALNILALVGFILVFAQCDPVAGQWNPFDHPGTRCWDRAVQLIYACSVSGISAFLDLAFSVYPSIVLWSLQMPTWKRLSTMALMSLGFASFAIAVIKLISNTTLLGNPDVETVLYYGIQIGMWNSIENDFVLSAACLPSLPVFVQACNRSVRDNYYLGTKKTSHSFSSSSRYRIFEKKDDKMTAELACRGAMPGIAGRNTEDGYGTPE